MIIAIMFVVGIVMVVKGTRDAHRQKYGKPVRKAEQVYSKALWAEQQQAFLAREAARQESRSQAKRDAAYDYYHPYL